MPKLSIRVLYLVPVLSGVLGLLGLIDLNIVVCSSLIAIGAEKLIKIED